MHTGVGIDSLIMRCLTSADNAFLVMERDPAVKFELSAIKTRDGASAGSPSEGIQ